MKSSSLIRIIFLAVFAVFVLNFVILLVYFPLDSSSPSGTLSILPLARKNYESFRKTGLENLRKKSFHHQQQRPPVPARVKQKPKQNVTKQTAKTPLIANNDTVTTVNCPVYGCPIYPPELTIPRLNQSIRATLESSGYSLGSKPAPEAKQSPSKTRFEFASESFAMLSQQGKSHTVNQDRAVFVSPLLPELLPSKSAKSFLACIFDGHGSSGHEVAQEVVEKFPLILSNKLTRVLSKSTIENTSRYETKNNDRNSTGEDIRVRIEDYDPIDLAIRNALNETFLEVNEKGTAFSFLRGGCTASVTLRWGSKLYVANAGDSETIIVATSASSNQKLTKEQQQKNPSPPAKVVYETRRDKANQPAERERIEKLGGKVHINAQGFDPRVVIYSKVANEMVTLAMSRSIGDWEYKAVGVTAEPTIDLIDLSKTSFTIPSKTVYLLAASDGFWDLRQKQFYANRMAASFWNSNESNQNPKRRNDANGRFLPLYHLYDMMQRITPKVQTGYRDDITAMIVNLK